MIFRIPNPPYQLPRRCCSQHSEVYWITVSCGARLRIGQGLPLSTQKTLHSMSARSSKHAARLHNARFSAERGILLQTVVFTELASQGRLALYHDCFAHSKKNCHLTPLNLHLAPLCFQRPQIPCTEAQTSCACSFLCILVLPPPSHSTEFKGDA